MDVKAAEIDERLTTIQELARLAGLRDAVDQIERVRLVLLFEAQASRCKKPTGV